MTKIQGTARGGSRADRYDLLVSRATLSIELAQADRPRPMGSVIAGRLRVDPRKESTLTELAVELVWRTRGKGDRRQGVVDRVVLEEGTTLVPGRPLEHAFELTASGGPGSYQGTVVNVEWVVRARADMPWALDPRSEQIVTVQAGEEAPNAQLPTAVIPQIPARTRTLLVFFFVLLGLFGVAEVIGGLAAWFWPALYELLGIDAPEGAEAAGVLMTGLAMAVGSAIAIRYFLREGWATRVTGEFEVTATPEVLRPGDRVTIEVRGIARRDASLKKAVGRLVIRETAIVATGEGDATHRHDVMSEEQPLLLRALHAGSPWSGSWQFMVPKDAPATFGVARNELACFAEVEVQTGLGRVVRQARLEIRPPK